MFNMASSYLRYDILYGGGGSCRPGALGSGLHMAELFGDVKGVADDTGRLVDNLVRLDQGVAEDDEKLLFTFT